MNSSESSRRTPCAVADGTRSVPATVIEQAAKALEGGGK
jgi:hypothetical protein